MWPASVSPEPAFDGRSGTPSAFASRASAGLTRGSAPSTPQDIPRHKRARIAGGVNPADSVVDHDDDRKSPAPHDGGGHGTPISCEA